MRKCIICLTNDQSLFLQSNSTRCIICKEKQMQKCRECGFIGHRKDFGQKELKLCKPCFNAKERQRRITDPIYREKKKQADIKRHAKYAEQERAAANAYNRTPKGKYKYAIRIARRRELEWNLTLEQYNQLTDPPCFYCQNKLGPRTECGIGLDRLDNEKGYTMENVVSCCVVCNKIRGNWLSVEETRQCVKLIISMRNI